MISRNNFFIICYSITEGPMLFQLYKGFCGGFDSEEREDDQGDFRDHKSKECKYGDGKEDSKEWIPYKTWSEMAKSHHSSTFIYSPYIKYEIIDKSRSEG